MELPDPIPAYIAGYNARDVPAMLATLSQDVSFANLSGGTVTAEASGIDAFEALAISGAAAFSDRHQKVRQALTVAGTTIAEIGFSATVAADLPNGWTKGQQVAFTGRTLFEVERGTITRIVDEA